jgi:hypothetical protein
LGVGGLGEVWLAYDTVLDQSPVACKILRDGYFHDRCAIAGLKREVLLARRLRHPNILGVHTFWETPAHRFVVMEYVAGQNLEEALFTHGRPFKLTQLLPWLTQLCDALDYAHGQGVLHRDIKPANCLIDTQGAVRLTDFGIARTLQELAHAKSGEITSGTLLFMSPEQLDGLTLDARSDLYSLAASVYELLSGAPPFYRGPIVEKIRHRAPRPIAHLSPAVNAVLAEGLAKERSARPSNCGAFCAALVRVAGRGGECGAPPRSIPKREIGAGDTVPLPAPASGADAGRLGMLLLDAGVITRGQLDAACERQAATQERLGEALFALGYVNQCDVARVLAQQLNLTCRESIADEDMDFQVVRLVSEGAARQWRCLPLHWSEGRLTVAMADPFDFATINALETSVRARVETIVVPPDALIAAVDRVFAMQP